MVEAAEKTREAPLSQKKAPHQYTGDRISNIDVLKNLRARLTRAEKPPEIDTTNIPDYYNNTLYQNAIEMRRRHPEIGDSFDIVLSEIDKQSVENFGVFESKLFPGTAFTVTKLTLTPELIQRIAQKYPDAVLANPPAVENPTVPENDITVNFGYFLLPPQGYALDIIDMASDRFIRKIPKVAQAMRNGETIPNVEIYLLGNTTAFGGKISSEFAKAIRKKGFDAFGQINGEFINEVVLKGKDPKKTHLLLQGGSMGATNADQALKYIPEAQQANTQLLLDIPAGHHEPTIKNTLTKGIQAPVGLVLETAARMVKDQRTKDPDKRNARLANYLKTEKGIKDEDSNFKRLISLGFAGTKLVRGTPPSYVKGTYIRNATRDPLTTGFERGKRVLKDLGKPIMSYSMLRRFTQPHLQYDEPYPIEKAKVNIPFWKTGHALETAVDNTHFWFYRGKGSFNRWAQAIKYCQASPKQKGAEA